MRDKHSKKIKTKRCLTRFEAALSLSLSLSLSLTFYAAERSPFLHSWPSIPQDPKLEDKNRCWPPRENTGAALSPITITCATELRGTTLYPCSSGRKVKSGRIQSGRMTGWSAGPQRFVIHHGPTHGFSTEVDSQYAILSMPRSFPDGSNYDGSIGVIDHRRQGSRRDHAPTGR